MTALVLAYTLIGFFLLPVIIKWQMRKQIPPLAHRAVHVQQVRVNPYVLSLTIRGFSLTETNGAVFASFDEFFVNFQLWSSLFKRAFVFREIHLKNPLGSVIWEPNGTFNFSNLLTGSKPTSPGKSELPRIVIGALNIENGTVAFADLTRKQPFQQRYEPINIHLTNLSTLPERDAPYSIVATTPAGGTFEWTGDVSVNPLHSAGTFKLSGLTLKTYSTYAQEFTGLAVTDGQLAWQADYRFDYRTGTLDLDVQNAGVELANFHAGSDDKATTIGIGRLVVKQAAASVTKETASVGRVELSNLTGNVQLSPQARAAVDKLSVSVTGIAGDRQAGTLSVDEVNIGGGPAGLTVVGTTQQPKEPPAAATSSQSLFAFAADSFHKLITLIAKPLAVQVQTVQFDNASTRFTDESVAPPAVVNVEQINGRVAGLVWGTNAIATVDLKGKVDGFAPFTIAGRLNPAEALASLDLTFLLKDDALKPLSAYAAKYAGYAVEQGTVSLDLQYHVTERALKAENKLRVDQFRFGAASGSPDATKLPVKLAVALLQDRHGVINLAVPLSGRLDDPQFHVGKVIFQVFMNILVKAVTKPFSLLASLVPGGGNADLSYIAFVPGSTDFAEGEVKKLDTLATALYERPALSLEIAGSADPVKDRQALAKAKLLTQVKERRIAELPAKERATTTPESLILDPVDYERLIREIYAASLAGNKAALPPPPVKQNFGPVHPVATAAQPASLTALTFAEMEAKLIEAVPVSDAELRALIQNRAAKVQAYLLQAGKVEPSRLAVAAVKLPAEKGQCRVELGLK